LTLENWHFKDTPRKAYYGIVSASEIALLYSVHGKLLFEKNIRYYLGNEDVNLAIAETVSNQPSELFYLNNGLTITSSKIDLPGGCICGEPCQFTLQNFSVVNGAQTVGAIASVYNTNGLISPDAKLMVTIIEAEDSIEVEITKARNKQNTVRNVYFAALDPNQERLRQEMMISNIVYQYRPSVDHNSQDSIKIEDAAIAIACFSNRAEIVVAAKKGISELYERYYTELFSNSLSGVILCRYVRIFQYLDRIFTDSETAAQGSDKMFYRHGRFFILNILSRCHKRLLNKPEIILSESDRTELSRIGLELAESIYRVTESQFGNDRRTYLTIFRNLTDVQSLTSLVMQELTSRNA